MDWKIGGCGELDGRIIEYNYKQQVLVLPVVLSELDFLSAPFRQQ